VTDVDDRCKRNRRPEAARRQQRALRALMTLDATQDVIERLDDPRPLVQHHALGTLAHRRVGDLGASSAPRPGEAVQHPRGPDAGDHLIRWCPRRVFTHSTGCSELDALTGVFPEPQRIECERR